ncbi:MAG: hypothetical protein LUD40_02285 [Phocaeicola dorei]|nr:hypothetical protein [Phocaeicola dorei]
MELKRRMTVGEMTEYMCQHSCKIPNKVTVGRFARQLGYQVYKPMINRKIHLFYINEQIPPNESEGQ